ncbi:MAG: GntR family transcriptional regulator [Thermodesulfobacteriota bacterium]
MASVLKDHLLPLYMQAAKELQGRIQNGDLKPNDRLPSLERLAAEFHISRITARQAVSLLERDGLIWRKQGKGTFVSPKYKAEPRLELHTDWSMISRMIEGTTVKLLKKAVVQEIPKLSPTAGKLAPAYTFLKRVHSKDGSPYGVIDIYLDERVYDKSPFIFLKNPILPFLEKVHDLKIKNARQTLTVGSANLQAAKNLKIEVGSPVALVRRVISDENDTIIYVGDITYRGDYIKLEIDMIK